MSGKPKRLLNLEISEISAVAAGSNPLADKIMVKTRDKVESNSHTKNGDQNMSEELKKQLEEKQAEIEAVKKSNEDLAAKVNAFEKEIEKSKEVETKVEKSAAEIEIEKMNSRMEKMQNELAFEKAKPLAKSYFSGHACDNVDVVTKAYQHIMKADAEVQEYFKSIADGLNKAKEAMTGTVGTQAEGNADAKSALNAAVEKFAAEKSLDVNKALASFVQTAEGRKLYNEAQKA